ncbi:RNA polymerase subunit sigma-70 [Aquihabitans sp. G128]|uniref:RNA polymerase subunit sigma-70 n=1 Tax=Aquihabitans sp. G128 TaxID=2849779 RepID=UPI001C215E3B|nr:RNA polymerase subunit sigma-70 [Aquihabitans sp. G128]QXC60723.1 RNA polymerase subunit sigma-70 [Aquihabitans sp. G128]
MGRAERRRPSEVDDVAAAVAGDERAWARVVGRHHRELHVHCYRMLGNFEEAEDTVQEVFLRAWRKRDAFDGGPHLRAWLYRIATNACLDVLRKKRRRVAAHGSYAEVGWLQPYPDRLLDEVVASTDDEPDEVAVARETIELAYLAALQVLPARQRAALILRDVLGWTAAETADALETTVPAANSALQRARATLQQELPRSRSEWTTAEPSEADREVLARFIDAHQRGDAEASVALATADIRITMPPYPMVFEGLDGFAPPARTGLRPRVRGRVAVGADVGEPPAGGGQLPPPPRQHRLGPVQARRPPHPRRRHRRDHHVRLVPLPRLRPPAHPAHLGRLTPPRRCENARPVAGGPLA